MVEKTLSYLHVPHPGYIEEVEVYTLYFIYAVSMYCLKIISTPYRKRNWSFPTFGLNIKSF